jgi:HEPN domain-containing protein
MPPDEQDLNDPDIWMQFAKSDLALARAGRLPDVRLGALCFHCQQAAEKALKAVLLRYQVEFPPTHNLQDLFNLLPSPVSAPPEIKDAVHLSGFVIKGRYPLDFLDIQPAEYEKAVGLAEKVLRWAEKALKG